MMKKVVEEYQPLPIYFQHKMVTLAVTLALLLWPWSPRRKATIGAGRFREGGLDLDLDLVLLFR